MNKPKKSTFKKFNDKFELSEDTKNGIKAIKFLLLTILIQAILWLVFPHKETELISPVEVQEVQAMQEVAQEPEATESAKVIKVDVQSTHTGTASYYSRNGCVGCSPAMTMANGKPLDDNALTVAFNRAKIGSMVRVTNQKTGESVVAEVTDTGGFERHNRIIDLTIATRDSINCTNLCQVKVELL